MASISQDLRAKICAAKQSDPTLSSRVLGRMFGVHDTTVLRILNKGSEPIRKETPEPAPQASQVFEDEELSGKWTYGKHFTYNGSTDTYVMILRCRPHPLVLSGEKFRAMKRAYSNWDNQEATVNEICRRFGIPRDQFMEVKTIHGWTHDQEPFTREEVMSGDLDTMADDAYQLRRQTLWESFEKKKWEETKKAAENWNRLEQTFIQPLREHVETFAPAYTPSLVNLRRARNQFAVVTNTGELHFGKSGWVSETGEEYNREIANQRLSDARANMLEEVADRGRPEKFFWTFGNDQLHIDNEQGTTTRGTPQDCDGTAARVLREGFELFLRDADALLAVAPVDLVYVPGNHDRLLSYALLNMVSAWYRNEKRMTITVSARTRSYATYGHTLMGFGHGDGALKPKDFISTMAKEAAEHWSHTRHRAFFTGHLHTEVVRELIGGTHYQMRSLSGQDRYHERNGFLSESGMNSYVIDKERGVTNAIMWKVPASFPQAATV